MREDVLQTLQPLVQDVIAPDARELKANQASLAKLSERVAVREAQRR